MIERELGIKECGHAGRSGTSRVEFDVAIIGRKDRLQRGDVPGIPRAKQRPWE